MTTEEIDSGNSLVSFTITLPQKFADEITQRAKYKALKAEEMLQMEIISYIERKERILNDIRRREEKRTKQSTEEHIALMSRQLEESINNVLRERERAEHKLYDFRNSVKVTEEQKKTHLCRQKEIEEELKNLLDEIVESPYDKTLVDKVQTLTEELHTAKCFYSNISSQYEDALGCFLEQKSKLMELDADYHHLKGKYEFSLKRAARLNEKKSAEEKEQEVEMK
jgi:hypothetical protein